MKQRWMIGAAVLLALMMVGAGRLGRASFTEARSTAAAPAMAPIAQQPVASGTGAPLGVDALMTQVRQPTGPVTVRGVVSAANSEEGRFTLIDAAEVEECGATTCAELALPVAWQGPMPAVAERIDATGRVATQDGKLVFVAADLVAAPPSTEPRR